MLRCSGIRAGLAPPGARVEGCRLSGRARGGDAPPAVVELGRGSDDDVLARAARFVATVEQVTSRYHRPLEYADLRHADGYAVRLKGVSTTTDAASSKTPNKKKGG